MSDRLFVPLSTEPYRWFESGQKTWELRLLRRQFNLVAVRVGRRVELRRGYSTGESLWGEITAVRTDTELEWLFRQVPFRQVIPTAKSRAEAIWESRRILGTLTHHPTRYIAFRVKLEEKP